MKIKLLAALLAFIALAGCSALQRSASAVADGNTTGENSAVLTEPVESATKEPTVITPEFTASGYTFTADFSPVVVMDAANEFYDDDNTTYTLGVKLTLTGADESTLYFTAENTGEKKVTVQIADYFVNGLYFDYYNEWQIPAGGTEEVSLRIPNYALKWIGTEGISTLAFDEVTIHQGLLIDEDAPRFTVKDISVTVDDSVSQIDVPEGLVLWEGAEGKLTFLGIDYDDNLYPRAMFRLDSFQPEVQIYDLPVTTEPPLYADVRIVSVNGHTSEYEGQCNISSCGLNSSISDAQLRPFPVENPQEGFFSYVPVGEVKEIVLRFSVSATALYEFYIQDEEITIDVEASGLTLWEDPYDWMHHPEFQIPEEWQIYYEELMAE